MLRDLISNSLYACGAAGLPKTLFIAGRQWSLTRTFKHDFFAATGLYKSVTANQSPERVVLKVSRLQRFFGIPAAWFGRFLTQREYRLLERVQFLDQVPQIVSTYGRNGFVYRFIEGQSLDEKPRLPDTFFEDLKSLLRKIHSAGICYLDFNKRGNILLGTDNRPYIIDFQISMKLTGPILRHLGRLLQHEDYYHLLKHKRRFRPDLLTDTEKALSRHKSLPIKMHRFLTVPVRTVRRRLLGLLYRKQLLGHGDTFDPTPENDPVRFNS